MSGAQLVYDCVQHKWIRNLDTCVQKSRLFKQLITLNGSAFRIRSPTTKYEVYVRDYREIPDPEMESAYTEKLNTRPCVEVRAQPLC